MLIIRWMYEAAIPFNAITYLSFQPMIEVIDQYGIGMKGPTLHEVSGPLVRVLCLVDGENKASMGYIYEAMNRVKDAIVGSLNGNEDKYKEIFKIIDKRWEIQLHRFLHVEEMEDGDSHGGAQDDFVFDDNNLTWGDVAKAIGAKEARTLPFRSLINEDEDGEAVDSIDEEDGEGYKCDDGNDDVDFFDLEDE
ncbi:hypothetical protein CK203_089456 [Vitis vinifera]|uniref:Uncharacterized protein n=1 Tax=Vitis vinifera TaxID=29760 RepID=A0A438E8U1_VITVI|nr:hypothetical protein CK203_089456 [Vitis vinifera]